MASEKSRQKSLLPDVARLRIELTFEQAAMIYQALVHERRAQAFNASALHTTEKEREAAKRNLFVIDRLKGMFE